jgi:hypothetical protein
MLHSVTAEAKAGKNGGSETLRQQAETCGLNPVTFGHDV